MTNKTEQNDPAWTLALKVREALDRKSCPGYYMDVAVESVVANFVQTTQAQGVDEREAFEAWYCQHAANLGGFTFTPQDMVALREGDHYGEHRGYLNGLWRDWQSCCAIFGRAALAQQTEPVAAVPEGWKLVPVEPTEEMLSAAHEGDRAYTLRNFGDIMTVQQGPYDHWVAMLAASPTPPAQEVK